MHAGLSRGETLMAIGLIAFLAVLTLPPDTAAPEASHVTEAPHPLHPAAVDRVGGKRYRRGFYDVMQINPNQPAFWIWVEDDTSDGVGVEHYLFHASYLTPGPENPGVTNDVQFNAYEPTTLQEAIDYIILNNAHVNDPSELLIQRHDVVLQ